MISILFTEAGRRGTAFETTGEQKVLVTSFRREHNSLESVFFHLTDLAQGEQQYEEESGSENEMKRYTRNMKCAWIILGVNLVLALFA